MVLDPAVAVKVPPLQSPVALLGVATTRFAGSVSVKPTPVRATEFADGLVMTKLRVETPFCPMNPGLKALVIEGGRSTKTLADAELPVIPWKFPPPWSKVPVMGLVTLFWVPELILVTFTEYEQYAEPRRFKTCRAMLELPGLAVTVPPSPMQLPAALLGFPTTRPLGRLSINSILTRSAEVFGLVMVKLNTVVAFTAMRASANALAAVG